MAVYKKTVRTGKFAKPLENYKEGDLITILDEGVEIDGKFGTQTIFKMRMVSGEELTMPFNVTTMNNMIDAYGEDSKAWIGKEIKVWRILQNVQGKMIKVTYLSHPSAEVAESGDFVIPGKQAAPKEESTVPYPEEEISPADIPF